MATDNNKAFAWDDTIENESKFVLFPAGIYKFKVTGFEREYHSGSEKVQPCNKAALTITVEDEYGRTTDIRDGIFLISRFEWKLCQFFTAIGLRKHGEKLKMDWSRVLGAEGICRVIVDEYTGSDDKQHQNNKIDAYLDPEQYPMPTTAKTAPSWKGGKF